jgi:MFS family permease
MDQHIKISYPWFVIMGLGLGFLLGSFDITALSLALVWIQKDLSLSLSGIDWLINAYAIAFASFLIPAGRLSDIHGHRKIYLSGAILIAIASLFGGFSQNAWQLVVSRALQGFASALLWPGIQSITMQIFPKKLVGRAIGVLLLLGGIGMASGPVLSGILIDTFSWRSVLFMNVPIAILSFLLILVFLPKDAIPKTGQKVDLLGFLFLAAFSFSLIFAIDLGGKIGFQNRETLAWLAATIGLFWLFIVREDNTDTPLIDLTKLNSTSFIMGIIFRATMAFAFFSTLFLSSYAFQHIATLSPDHTGIFFLPLTVTLALFSLFGGTYSERFGAENLMHIGMVCMGCGVIAFGIAIRYSLDFSAIFAPFFFMGMGLGIFIPNNTLFTVHSVPKSHWGVATGIIYMVNLIFFSIAITIASFFMRSPGFDLAMNLLKKGNIPLTEMKIALINAVMRGMSSISDALLQFSSHSNEVYEAIRTGFLSAMSFDLWIAGALIFLPMFLYLFFHTKTKALP